MKFDKGLYTDCQPADQPAGTYRFAKNMVEHQVSSLENEDGFQALTDIVPYTLIGVIPVRNDWVVFSTDNVSSEIGLVERSGAILSYTQIMNDPDLNFNTTAPIKGEYRKDITNSRVVAWIDDNNTPRILNIDDLTGIDDVTDLDVFPNIQNPKLTNYATNDTGGALPVGAIIPITRYKTADGSTTNWFVHDHTFYINNEKKIEAFEEYDGAPPETISNKSITFDLEDCDTTFSTIVVGYIQSVNNILQAYEVSELDNSTTLTVTITGNEETVDVVLDDILTPTAIYDNAKAITQVAGRLGLANLTSPELPDLQAVALDIKIDYTHELVTVVQNTDNHKDNLPPTFMPGEVYAFYLGIELNKGGWIFYHIPGRPSVSGDLDAVANEGLNYTRFQVENRTNIGGAYSNMGYWQNDGETYPNTNEYVGAIAGDLRGQPVRHHRFPTLGYLVNTFYSATSTVGITQLPRLGISVSAVNIPTGIQSQIKRWKIFYAKKTTRNSLVLGSDLVHFSASTTDDTSVRWSSGGNWRTRLVSTANKEMPLVHTDILRSHSLDLHYNKESIAPVYALFQYKLRRVNLNAQYAGFRSTGGRITVAGQYQRPGPLSFNDSLVASGVIDYTVPASTTRTDFTPFIKRLDNFKYVAANSLIENLKTVNSEGVYTATINNPGTSFDSIEITRLHMAGTSDIADPAQFEQFDGSNDPDNGKEDTMFYQHFNLLSAVHNSFSRQEAIATEGYALPAATTITAYGGDSFLCYMSYLAAAPRTTNETSTQFVDEGGVRMWKGYIGYSKHNFNLRHEDTGDIATLYYGKTDPRTLINVTVTNAYNVDTDIDLLSLVLTNQELNKIEYNSDFSRLNNFTVGTIFHPSNVNQTTFPNTVIVSTVQQDESKEFSWRTFAAADRVIVGQNRGDIINIQGFRNRHLIIHTEDSLFRTRTDMGVKTDQDTAYLQTVDLFSLTPDEILTSSEGYAGTQHKFGCIQTKAGYAFVDNKRGKVFLYNGESLDEISSNGMRIFFRDFMRDTLDDNPFVTTGYTLGYDERLNRLIVSKKNGAQSWTMSYNPSRRCWISYHDYIPSYMFTTSDNSLYSVDANQFYLNNPEPDLIQKGQFYGATINPAFVDHLYADRPDITKVYNAVEWISECFPVSITLGQPDPTLDYNTTCTHLTLSTADHSTGRISLTRISDIDDLYNANIRIIGRTWYFDDIRDISTAAGARLGFYDNFDPDPAKLNSNVEWFDKRKFKDKYLICRFEYDNQTNIRFILMDTKAVYRYER